MGQYFFFCSCLVIALAYFFGKMAPATSIIDEISLYFSAMDNALLHASGHSTADKIEERITFALSHHVYIYLNQRTNDTTSLPLQTHLIYPVAVEDIDLR